MSTISLGNCIQSYSTLQFTRQVYSGSSPSSSSASYSYNNSNSNSNKSSTPTPQVTALQSRTFGTWTLLSAIIRLYAAYNINNPVVYQLALWTYVIAWGHFVTEWLVFGSAKWGRGLAGPVIVANLSVGWMVAGWGFYVG